MQFTHDRYYDLVITAPTSFNIHIERDGGGFLAVYKRTAGKNWDLIGQLPRYRVMDADIHNTIEREFLIRSESKPTLCAISFAEGEMVNIDLSNL